jgi:hypothetical protein
MRFGKPGQPRSPGGCMTSHRGHAYRIVKRKFRGIAHKPYNSLSKEMDVNLVYGFPYSHVGFPYSHMGFP